MKKRYFLASISLILILALLSITVACCYKPDNTKAKNDFNGVVHNNEHIALAMSSKVSLGADDSVSKTITATVLPETATNKKVDWDVAWADENAEGEVTDFVTVTPESDGSCTATVTCHKAFTGNIVITVTTRESQYSATCVVTFVGIPTDIVVSSDDIEPDSYGIYKFGIGKKYNFKVDPVNPFNSVNEEYTKNFTFSIKGYGSLKLGNYEEYTTGGSKWYETKTVELDSLKDYFLAVQSSYDTFSVTYVKTIESYYANSYKMDAGRTTKYIDKFQCYVDYCYFAIVITENLTGLTKEIKIEYDTTVVTSVTVDNTEITF